MTVLRFSEAAPTERPGERGEVEPAFLATFLLQGHRTDLAPFHDERWREVLFPA
jgi:hypothetical protein